MPIATLLRVRDTGKSYSPYQAAFTKIIGTKIFWFVNGSALSEILH